jgi:hypothetical protein
MRVESSLPAGQRGSTNVDQAINNFVFRRMVPTTLDVTSPASTPYNLVVTRDAAFDLEVNNSPATAQSLDGAKGCTGKHDKNGAYTAMACVRCFRTTSAGRAQSSQGSRIRMTRVSRYRSGLTSRFMPRITRTCL